MTIFSAIDRKENGLLLSTSQDYQIYRFCQPQHSLKSAITVATTGNNEILYDLALALFVSSIDFSSAKVKVRRKRG